VSQSKITGEEERYSRLGLLDMAANVDGSERAFAAVRPALSLVDGSLATTIDARFAALDALLARYQTGDGYRSYDGLSDADRKAFAQAVNGVAEPLSKVAGELVAPSARSR
ncbi:MAG TPA: imelysin family protein, partial [Candidatus Dormibacteraeota bacterium]